MSKLIPKGLGSFAAIICAIAFASAPAEASGGLRTAWGDKFVSCAAGSIANVTVQNGTATVSGTVTPCGTIPVGAYFAVGSYTVTFGVLHMATAAAPFILYDTTSSSTYFAFSGYAVSSGQSLCLASHYGTRLDCVMFQQSAGVWSVTRISTSDPQVSYVLEDASTVPAAPRCGTCW